MKCSRWFWACHSSRSILATFAFTATLYAAEPAAQEEPRESVKSPAPADLQSSDLLSKLRFYGEFGPIYLRRQGNESFTFGGVLAPSFDLGWKTGLEARVGFSLGQFGAEFRWFDVGHVLEGWSDTDVTGKRWLTISQTTGQVTDGFIAMLGSRLQSNFTNMEGNFRWQVHPYVTALASVRFISLRDELATSFGFSHFNIQGLIRPNSANIETATRNKLWGGQLGIDARLPIMSPKLLAGGTFKLAYLHDSVDHHLNLVQQTGSAIHAGGSDGQNSWAIELGFDGRYNIFPWFSVVFGYQALWIQRIAQAADQVNKLNLNMNNGVLSAPAGLGSINGHSLWFHGPRAAIVFQLPD